MLHNLYVVTSIVAADNDQDAALNMVSAEPKDAEIIYTGKPIYLTASLLAHRNVNA